VPKTKHYRRDHTPKEVGRPASRDRRLLGYAITKVRDLRMTPHVFVRPGELRQAEWSEFDLDRAVWSIPPRR
jgi:integrase